MKEVRYQIRKIRLLEGIFNPSELHLEKNYITEITEDGIITYETEYKSRKQFNKKVVDNIPQKEIKQFFEDIYDFSRRIDDYEKIVDDCSYTVTLYYEGFHKEIFENGCYSGDEWLVGKINEFVDKWTE